MGGLTSPIQRLNSEPISKQKPEAVKAGGPVQVDGEWFSSQPAKTVLRQLTDCDL